MSRPALLIVAALVFLDFMTPVLAKTVHSAPFRLRALKGDSFVAPALLESDFGGELTKVAYVPAAVSDDSARALQAAIPAAPQRELVFEHAGKSLKYVAVGDLSKPAKVIVVYVHGFGDDRSQGVNETRFGGNLGRLKRLIADNVGIYLSPDFSGFGQSAEAQVGALIADYSSRSPGAPVFVACISYGGSVCWRLAADLEPSSPVRGVLIFGAPVDRSFTKRAALGGPPIYLGIGTKDGFASWRAAEQFFRELKTAAPDYPIKLTIFDAGEHATAIRLTDWVPVLNWMLAGSKGAADRTGPSIAAAPPCPRPRPRADDNGQTSYCGQP